MSTNIARRDSRKWSSTIGCGCHCCRGSITGLSWQEGSRARMRILYRRAIQAQLLPRGLANSCGYRYVGLNSFAFKARSYPFAMVSNGCFAIIVAYIWRDTSGRISSCSKLVHTHLSWWVTVVSQSYSLLIFWLFSVFIQRRFVELICDTGTVNRRWRGIQTQTEAKDSGGHFKQGCEIL